MHIKQVIISGFRSFRSQSEIEPFSPKHNVIVGRNGSGKSNFFDAIQFVLLNQRFQSLRQEERQHLLHEGAGANVVSAFVELIFDNSDGRLAQDGDEVVLRRTVGLKKDEFYLNRRRVTKQEVSSLLESAGFSKSNPYYIVQQGKVSALALMKDQERFNLLKEVAGTKVYEERRTESLQIMEETNNKRDKIQEVINYIEERLSELEEEKEELGVYQKHDRQRRALEYTLYDKELRQAREDLEGIEQARSDALRHSDALHNRLRDAREAVKERENILFSGHARLSRLERDRTAADNERNQALGARAKLELEVKDIAERVANDGDEQVRLAAELTSLEASISARELELEGEAVPAYNKARSSVQATEAEIAQATAQTDELYARQGRKGQFQTAGERDAALTSQVRSIRSSAKAKAATVTSLEKQTAELEAQHGRQEARAKEMEAEIKMRHAQAQTVTADLVERTKRRDEMAEERKERWRALEDLQDKISKLKNALERSERDLHCSMPRHVASGVSAVERHVKEQRIEGYLGTVFENFSLTDPKFATAVEIAGGGSLFHTIVDTDETAARLVRHLERGKRGRVTFMPLSKLSSREIRYPDSSEEGAVPLIQVAIKFRPEVKTAMMQIFGKKLIAPNLEVASAMADKYDMDTLTMEGDEVNRKGGLCGGYQDERGGKLVALERIRSTTRELKALSKDQKEMQQKVTQADQAVTNLMGEVQKLEAKRTSVRHVVGQTSKELGLIVSSVATTKESLLKKKDLLDRVRLEAQQEENRADLLEAEIGTPLMATLSPEDQARLTHLTTVLIPELNSRLKGEFEAFEVASANRQHLLSLLQDNLQKRRTEVRALLDPEMGGVGGSRHTAEAQERSELLARKQEELARTIKALDECEAQVAKVEEEVQGHRQEIKELTEEVEEVKAREGADAEELGEAAKVAEKLLNKWTLMLRKRTDNETKIQGLGSLPGSELEEFKGLSIKALMKRLHKVNESLKKYSHVNKKALDQCVSFAEQREALLRRKKELDVGAGAIQELVDALDQQKDEAILRTFKGVSDNFSEVFSELVPSGSGEMIMKRRGDAKAGDEEEELEVEEEEGEEGGEEEGEGKTPSKGKGKTKGKAKRKSKGKGKGKATTSGETDPEAESGARDTRQSTSFASVSEFIGVQVRVTFAAAGETYLMSQLSGGQKAVVALALIFAIQRCDPAPFYLFDEIDQALDSSYRAAVASLIQKQAHSPNNPTQFITTTFRPEMVSVASRCYGISHQNKVSNIHELPKDAALSFVANIMNEEEAVGVDLKQPEPRRRGPLPPRNNEEEEEDEEDGDGEEGGGQGSEDDMEEPPTAQGGRNKRKAHQP